MIDYFNDNAINEQNYKNFVLVRTDHKRKANFEDPEIVRGLGLPLFKYKIVDKCDSTKCIGEEYLPTKDSAQLWYDMTMMSYYLYYEYKVSYKNGVCEKLVDRGTRLGTVKDHPNLVDVPLQCFKYYTLNSPDDFDVYWHPCEAEAVAFLTMCINSQKVKPRWKGKKHKKGFGY